MRWWVKPRTEPDVRTIYGLGSRVEGILRLGEQDADDLRAEARREAEEIVAAARRKAEEILAAARQEASHPRGDGTWT
jgi:vacuolar-type H+-ATPase subunit E/Vma4